MPNDKCPPGEHCVNVEKVIGDYRNATTELRGEVELLKSLVDDLRSEVRELPRRVSDQIRDDRAAVKEQIDGTRAEAKESFGKGAENFTNIYTRLNSIERALVAIWIFLTLAIAGKVGALLGIPILSKIF